MILKNELIQHWLKVSSLREKFILFIVGFFLIYLFWNILFEWSVRNKKAALEKEKQQLSAEWDVKNQELQSYQRIIASPSFAQSQAYLKELHARSASLGSEFKNIEFGFVPNKALTEVTNALIEPKYQVTLISLKTFATEPWSINKMTSGTTNLDIMDAYKHPMEIAFRGSYFDTLDFLSQLEKLPWRIYWDNLQYKVLTYPEAEVTARFYVLSSQKD